MHPSAIAHPDSTNKHTYTRAHTYAAPVACSIGAAGRQSAKDQHQRAQSTRQPHSRLGADDVCGCVRVCVIRKMCSYPLAHVHH